LLVAGFNPLQLRATKKYPFSTYYLHSFINYTIPILLFKHIGIFYLCVFARGIVAEPLIYSLRSSEYISDGADSPTRAKQVKPEGRNAQSEAARQKKNKIEWLFIVYFYILFVTCITFYNFIINFT
jgi:hypothetical protein